MALLTLCLQAPWLTDHGQLKALVDQITHEALQLDLTACVQVLGVPLRAKAEQRLEMVIQLLGNDAICAGMVGIATRHGLSCQPFRWTRSASSQAQE